MFRGSGERWTINQDRQLRELTKQYKSTADIAKVMGRTVTAVITRMSVLKGSFHVTQRAQWTPEEDERLAGLKESGATWEEIADDMGRPVGGLKHRWISLKHQNEE
jgi:hypothetical protein